MIPEETFVYCPGSSRLAFPVDIHMICLCFYEGWGWFVSILLPVHLESQSIKNRSCGLTAIEMCSCFKWDELSVETAW